MSQPGSEKPQESSYVKDVLGDLNIDVQTLKPIDSKRSIEYVKIDENPLDLLKTKEEKERELEREKRLKVVKSWAYLPMKTKGEKLLYGCGASYLTGLCGGGIYGFVKGWTKPQPILNYKLRLNRALNLSTKYGPWAGNSMGVLGLMYTSFDSLLNSIRKDKPNDYYNHVGAGFISGALYKSTAGLKVATLSGGIFAGMVALCGLGTKAIKDTKEKIKEKKEKY
jgi:inner membrane translocase subunit Tim23